MKRVHFFLTIAACFGVFVVWSPPTQAAATYCKWRCIRFQAPSPACRTAQTRDIGSHLATWVFGNDQHFSFPDATSCTPDACLHKCQEACHDGDTSTAYEGAIAEVDRSFCIVEPLGPAALPLSECISGAMVWDRPACIEPPTSPTPTPTTPTTTPTPTPTPGSPTTLDNPLHTTSISELIARLIRAISGIAGSMALLMFVVGGVMWMTAEGSDRVGMAQTILKNASIGLVLIFLSYSLVSLFLAVLGL